MQITIIVNNHAPAVSTDPAQTNRETKPDVIELSADEWSRRQADLKVRAA